MKNYSSVISYQSVRSVYSKLLTKVKSELSDSLIDSKLELLKDVKKVLCMKIVSLYFFIAESYCYKFWYKLLVLSFGFTSCCRLIKQWIIFSNNKFLCKCIHYCYVKMNNLSYMVYNYIVYNLLGGNAWIKSKFINSTKLPCYQWCEFYFFHFKNNIMKLKSTVLKICFFIWIYYYRIFSLSYEVIKMSSRSSPIKISIILKRFWYFHA